MPFSDIPGFKPYHMLSGKLRQLLLKNGIQDKCAICGLSKWLNKDIVLHTDHIDGNLLDNTFGNLRLICPNCHSQTDTYSGRNAKINRRPEITDSDVRDACAWIEERGGTPSASMILSVMGRRSFTPVEKTNIVDICKNMGISLRTRSNPLSDKRRKLDMIKDIDSRIYNLNRSRNKIVWDDEWLSEALKTRSLLDISRELGVSDVAVKKHCKSKGIVVPSNRRALPRKSRTRDEKMVHLESLHGTLRGYAIELELGLPTCDACRIANRNK